VHILHVSYSSKPVDGGISTSVAQLVDYQRLTIAGQVGWIRLDELGPSSIFHYVFLLLKLKPDILHIHGLWRYPTRLNSLYRLFNIRVVISPHGMLHPEALKASWLRKRVSFILFERPLFLPGHILHALNAFESSCIRSLLPQAHVITIPNGVLIRSRSNQDCREFLSLPPDSKILLYFGRYHPGKNITQLAESWMSTSHLIDPNWWLVFVGYGDTSLLACCDGRQNTRIRRFGPFFGEDKHIILSSVNAFVLPSAFEALPMSALEAMSYSLPCLLTDQCNMSFAFKANAAYRVDQNSLSGDLLKFFAMKSDEHLDMGDRAFSLVSSDYAWPRIASLFFSAYRSILAHP